MAHNSVAVPNAIVCVGAAVASIIVYCSTHQCSARKFSVHGCTGTQQCNAKWFNSWQRALVQWQPVGQRVLVQNLLMCRVNVSATTVPSAFMLPRTHSQYITCILKYIEVLKIYKTPCTLHWCSGRGRIVLGLALNSKVPSINIHTISNMEDGMPSQCPCVCSSRNSRAEVSQSPLLQLF